MWPPIAKRVLHPVPTGWDYAFNQRRPRWVIAHYKDGRKVGGWFGEQSFASAWPETGDIYLEQLWHLDDNGAFLKASDRSDGAVIRGGDLVIVEFFTEEEEDGRREDTER
jgi:hypothetical protein